MQILFIELCKHLVTAIWVCGYTDPHTTITPLDHVCVFMMNHMSLKYDAIIMWLMCDSIYSTDVTHETSYCMFY